MKRRKALLEAFCLHNSNKGESAALVCNYGEKVLPELFRM